VAPESSPQWAGGFLGLLSPQDRSDLLRLGHNRRYRADAYVIIQGDHSESVFLVTEGRVKVVVDTVDGHQVVLTVLGRGDVLGEFEAIDSNGGPRIASNVALEPVECRALAGADFRRWIDSHPDASLALLKTIIRRLRAADRRRTASGSLDATHRLAAFLLEMVDQAGPDGTSDVDLALTQEELAGLIASSRESVVRALAALRARHLVSTARRRITIVDVEGLRRFAG